MRAVMCSRDDDPTGRDRPRVLVACEFSGIVRDAFRAIGCDAMSVDLLPSERPGPHIVGDATPLLRERWDLVIAHPPCTYLALSGVRWLMFGNGVVRDWDRWERMLDAADFFRACLAANAPRVAVENPIAHGRARLPKASQYVQPWQFGHGEIKATGLWLRGLPKLTPTEIVDGRVPRVHHMAPGPERWRERSRTFPGIAAAMAAQWGPLLFE